MNKFYLLLILFVGASIHFYAQDDLLNDLDSAYNGKEVETAAFKALTICNLQSTKTPVKGEFYFLVSHRFGDLTNGLDNFFGLDNALTKIAGIYGVNNWLSFGLSRQTYQKTYELGIKYKMANQEKEGFPVTIVGYNTIEANSALKKDALLPGLEFKHRLSYSTQLFVSRKFTEKFSAELAPMYVYKNLYKAASDQKDMFLLGAGARLKVSKRTSLNIDYATRLTLPDEYNSIYHNPLTVGVDMETGGHIFQFVLSNAQPMNDVTFLTNTSGNWNGGGIFFGFNMYRVF